MDKNKSPKGRKRPAKQVEQDFFWDCSVCTYKNNPEAFKCVMCDVRKGTSTRKSRINPDLVAVQVQHALLPPPPPLKFAREEVGRTPIAESGPSNRQEVEEGVGVEEEQAGPSSAPTSSQKTPRGPVGGKTSTPKVPKSGGRAVGGANNRSKLRNVDRKNATTMSVTVDDATVVITEYKLKPRKEKKSDTSRDSSLVVGPPGTPQVGPGSSKGGSGADSDHDSELGPVGGSVVGPGQSRGPSEELDNTRSS